MTPKIGERNMEEQEPSKIDREDIYARYFEVCHLPLPHRDRVWQAVARHLERHYIPQNASVLELGAGYCPFINQVRSTEKYAVDQSDIVKKHAATGVRTFVQSCTNLSNLPSAHFDVVFASNLLEHLTLAESAETLRQARNRLKSGGRLILLQPNFAYAYRQYFDDVSHKQIFTHVSLSDFVKINGFSIHAIKPKFLPLSMRGGRVPTQPWMVTFYLNSPFKPFAGQMLLVAERQSSNVEQ